MAKEDLSIYSLDDPFNRFVISPNTKLTVAPTTRIEETRAWSDFGVDFFDGDFTHQLTFDRISAGPGSRVCMWMLSNVVDDLEGLINNDDALLAFNLYNNGGSYEYHVFEVVEGVGLHDTFDTIPGATTLLYTDFIRDESVGSFGSLTANFYSDLGRTTLVKSVVHTLNAKQDFRNFFAFNSLNNLITDVAQIMSVSIYDIDLGLDGAGQILSSRSNFFNNNNSVFT